MFETDCMCLRSEIVENLKTERLDVLPLSEEELHAHLEDFLSRADSEGGLVSCFVFVDAVKSIPQLNLSDKEAYAVCGNAPCSANGLYDWRAFLPWSYSCISTIHLERLIGRRMLLRLPEYTAKTMGDAESLVDLQKMSDKLVSLLEVRRIDGEVSVFFKSELKDESRRSSILQPDRSPTKPLESHKTIVLEPSVKKERGEAPLEAFEILRVAKFLPLRGPSADSTIVDGLYFTLRVLENDPIICYDKPPLQIMASTQDAKYNLEYPLYLRLPSLGLVDQEAAEQFGMNLVRQLFIFFHNGKLELGMDN